MVNEMSDHKAQNDLNASVRGVRNDLAPAKADLSLGVLLNDKIKDPTARLACFRNIANRALSSAIYAAQRIVRERNALERDADGNFLSPTLDRRNEQDGAVEREAPVGLENRRNPQEELAEHAAVYATGLNYCRDLAIDPQYDLPQDVTSRVAWVTETARKALLATQPKFRDDTSPSEKLAFIARIQQAKTDNAFWKSSGSEIIGLVKDAIDNYDVPENDVDVIDSLVGVEAHQYAIQAGIGLQQSLVKAQLGLARFPAHTMVGRRLASDAAIFELYTPKVVEFVDKLELAYSGDIAHAVTNGRNLLSSDSIKAAYEVSINRALDRVGETMHDAQRELDAELAEAQK